MENKPVVALAEDLDWNTARLLGDEQCAQIIFPTLFDPGDVRLRCRCILVENRLSFFYDRNGWDRLWIGGGEFLLVPVENTAKNQSRENQDWPPRIWETSMMQSFPSASE